MTQTSSQHTFETTIVLSNSRKNLLATAMSDARHTMNRTESRAWQALTETPAERRARARAERIAWLAESF